jgi:hypothetical protein
LSEAQTLLKVPNIRTVIPADVDQDGRQDLVFVAGDAPSGGNTAVFVVVNDGTAKPFGQQPVQVSDSADFVSLAVADVNNDRRPDLILTTVSQSAGRIYLNTSSGGGVTFTAQGLSSYVNGNPSVTVTDFNGDGRADLLLGRPLNYGVLILNNGSAAPFDGTTTQLLGFASPPYEGPAFRWSNSAIADVDGDGRNDLIQRYGTTISDPGKLGVFRLTDVLPTAPQIEVPAPIAGTMLVKDLNADGKPDIVMAGADYYPRVHGAILVTRWFILFHSGSATSPYGTATPLPFGEGVGNLCESIAADDLNGDGKIDLAIGCRGGTGTATGTSYSGNVYLNDGSTQPFINAKAIAIASADPSSGDVLTLAITDIAGKRGLLTVTAQGDVNVQSLVEVQVPTANRSGGGGGTDLVTLMGLALLGLLMRFLGADRLLGRHRVLVRSGFHVGEKS